MIKIVLFDLGNVVLPFDLLRLSRRLSGFSPYSPEEIMTNIGYMDVVDAFETGRMSPKEFFSYVSTSCQLHDLTFEEFIPIFNDIFEEDLKVVQLLARLKNNYQLGLISNTNPIHVSHLRETYASLNHFDKLWFSNEAGLRKPHPDIYKLALDHFNIEPHEAVFIDDMEPNVLSAANLGIQGIHFQGADRLEEHLSKLGVKH